MTKLYAMLFALLFFALPSIGYGKLKVADLQYCCDVNLTTPENSVCNLSYVYGSDDDAELSTMAKTEQIALSAGEINCLKGLSQRMIQKKKDDKQIQEPH